MRIKINPTVIFILGLLLGFILAGGSLKAYAYNTNFNVTDIGDVTFYTTFAHATGTPYQATLSGHWNDSALPTTVFSPFFDSSMPANAFFPVFSDSTGPDSIKDSITFQCDIYLLCNGFWVWAVNGEKFGPFDTVAGVPFEYTGVYTAPPPILTMNPWVRIARIDNYNGSQSRYQLNIETNTGTSTGDSIEIKYISNFQNILPDTIGIYTTGIQKDTMIKNFPEINDDILVEVSLLSGTTTLITSPTYTIRVRDSITIPPGAETLPACDSSDGVIYYAFCTAMVFLFSPSDTSVNRFVNSYEYIISLKPFGYFLLVTDSIQGLNASTTPAFTMPEIPFQSAIFEPLKIALGTILWGVFAFVFYNKRLKNIEI